MTEAFVITIAQEALYTVLLICAPLLGVSLIIGLLVGMFQATTQLQDVSLSFVPKIVAVLITMVILAPWILTTLINFTQSLFQNIQHLAG